VTALMTGFVRAVSFEMEMGRLGGSYLAMHVPTCLLTASSQVTRVAWKGLR
jgi:hypothetical protein